MVPLAHNLSVPHLTSKAASLHSEKPVGHHIMLDMWNCQCADEVLEKEEYGIELMNRLGEFFTPLGLQSYQFDPYGWTATLMLAESHIAGHVWKECNRYAAFCLFTCSGSIPEKAVETLMDYLEPLNFRRLDSSRGPITIETPIVAEHSRVLTTP